DHLVSETVYTGTAASGTPSGAQTTYYVYDSRENLRFVITPEGRVTEYQYDLNGERISSILYTAATYGGAHSGPNGAPLENDVMNWVGESYVSGLVKGTATAFDKTQSQRTDYAYDLTGQIKTTTYWNSIKSDGSGAGVSDGVELVRNQVFDRMGRLLMQIDPRASGTQTDISQTSNSYNDATLYVTSYVYDGFNRVTKLQNDQGKTTITTYTYDASHNTVVTTTNPAATVTTKVYNPDGDLTSLSHTASSVQLDVTQYYYDANGWLRMVKDPTGALTHYIWDPRGWQVGVISPQNELTETVYNDDGQKIREIHYAGTVTAALVDASKNPLPIDLCTVRGGTRQDVRPVVDLESNTTNGHDYRTTYAVAGTAVAAVSGTLTITDVNGGNLTSAKAVLVNPLDGAAESLAVNVGSSGLVASYSSATGILTLTGTASAAT